MVAEFPISVAAVHIVDENIADATVDVQDHQRPNQSNRNVVIEDVCAVYCKHAMRTRNYPQGHINLTVRNITAQNCQSPIQISRTSNVHLINVRVSEHRGNIPPALLQDCRGVSLRDVVIESGGFTGPGVLLEDCDETLIDGVTLLGPIASAANAVRYRLTRKGIFSGWRITNVSAREVTEAGILLETVGRGKGTLSDYRIIGNLATVEDRIIGERGIY